MGNNLSIPDFLEDSLARFRHYRDESFADAVFNNLKIIRPDIYVKVRQTPDKLTGYNPREWNDFFVTLQKYWYG